MDSMCRFGSLGNSSTASGVASPEGRYAVLAVVYAVRTYFFIRARFTSFHTYASLPTFLFLCLISSCCSHARVFRKTLVHEFLIPIAILNGTSFFRQCNDTCTKENSMRDGDTSQSTIVTLYKVN